MKKSLETPACFWVFSHTLSGVPFKIESILIKATIILIGAVAYTTMYRISVGIRLRYSYRFSPDSIFSI